jgi:hypothetical protein
MKVAASIHGRFTPGAVWIGGGTTLRGENSCPLTILARSLSLPQDTNQTEWANI